MQRSKNAINWQEIASVPGQGFSSSIIDYSMKDLGLEAGQHYYRLQQFDFDGSSEYSNIEVISINSDQEGRKAISLYPNPINTVSELNIEGIKADHATLSIFGMQGNNILRQSIGKDAVIPMQELVSRTGIYLLYIEDGNDLTILKLIVEE